MKPLAKLRTATTLLLLTTAPLLVHPQRTTRTDWSTCTLLSPSGTPLTLNPPLTCPHPPLYTPWSSPPYCPPPLPSDTDDNDSPLEPDCVFTLTTFRGNQGISLITTPSLAASLSLSIDDSSVDPPLRDHLISPQPERPPQNLPYEIRNLPGRGKGTISKRRFKRHDVIMVGFPLLVMRVDFMNGDHFDEGTKYDMLERAVGALSEEQRGRVKALARSAGEKNWVLDVMKTNGFGIEIGGVTHMALFTDGSRVNHNCKPNAFWRFTNNNLAMEVVALTPISPGDEIGHSYTPLGHGYHERQQILRQWGFTCRCAFCSLPPAQRDISDDRRYRLYEIHSTLSQAADIPRQRVDQLVQEAKKLIELEGLQPQVVEYYAHFGRAYLALGDLREARRYIQMADDSWVLYAGVDHENVEGMRELWRVLMEAEREAEEE